MPYINTEEYKRLRREYNRWSFRRHLEKEIPKVCRFCGATEGIEYHHIMPLSVGGDNRLTNIIAVCNRCHQAIHLGHHINRYRTHAHNGRPRKAVLSPETEEILWKWANGQIGGAECKNLLGYSQSSHIHDLATYKEFIKKHGIQNIRNTLDVVVANGTLENGRQTSTIFYTDGDREFGYYNSLD